jgi:predicted nucleotidyltransferase
MGLLDAYEAVLRALPGELDATYGPRLLACAVFGSVARGTLRRGSDIDLLIVAEPLPHGRMRRVEEFLPVEDRLAPLLTACGEEGQIASISPVFKTSQELDAGSPLFLDMVEDARVLCDGEGILAARLERLRSRLRELGARRIWRGNAWHWVLKPDLRPGEVFEL